VKEIITEETHHVLIQEQGDWILIEENKDEIPEDSLFISLDDDKEEEWRPKEDIIEVFMDNENSENTDGQMRILYIVFIILAAGLLGCRKYVFCLIYRRNYYQ
jgi:hypothetical protein